MKKLIIEVIGLYKMDNIDDDCLSAFSVFMEREFGFRECESMYSGDIAGMLEAFNAGRLSGQNNAALTASNCELHHLKSAIASFEICGTPLHHLSFELSKHFDSGIKTADFVAEIKAKAVVDFCKSLKLEAMEKMPDKCSEDMLTGWKSGVMDARDIGYRHADNLVFEHQKQFFKIFNEAENDKA